jgi:hypothetical protein
MVAAAIPAAGTGLFYLCHDAGGNVKVLDSAISTTCPKGYRGPVTWGQAGPAGPIGPQGPAGNPGPRGERGPAGTVSMDSLAGSTCATSDGGAGAIQVVVDADNVVSLRCDEIDVTPGWCAENTPTVGPHMRAECDEASDTIELVCDRGWADVNASHDDGCEGGVPTLENVSSAPGGSDIVVRVGIPTSIDQAARAGAPFRLHVSVAYDSGAASTETAEATVLVSETVLLGALDGDRVEVSLRVPLGGLPEPAGAANYQVVLGLIAP